mmetsp:Transcript_26006/g.57421  ORF Transcript_26006/g.57421 Transcript_26006/m.57421 type:complete len:369 (+) Transcript_26006:102-1208(+)
MRSFLLAALAATALIVKEPAVDGDSEAVGVTEQLGDAVDTGVDDPGLTDDDVDTSDESLENELSEGASDEDAEEGEEHDDDADGEDIGDMIDSPDDAPEEEEGDDEAVTEFTHALDAGECEAKPDGPPGASAMLNTKECGGVECMQKYKQCQRDKNALCRRNGFPARYSSCMAAIKARGQKCKKHKENVRNYNNHKKKKTMRDAKKITHRRRGVYEAPGSRRRAKEPAHRRRGGYRRRRTASGSGETEPRHRRRGGYRRRRTALLQGQAETERSLTQVANNGDQQDAAAHGAKDEQSTAHNAEDEEEESDEEENQDDAPASSYKSACKTCNRRRGASSRLLCKCARKYGYYETQEGFSDIECGTRRRR